jgi:hypothetical protein
MVVVDGYMRGAVRQFVLCLSSMRRIDAPIELANTLSASRGTLTQRICRWYAEFSEDLQGGRDSYPAAAVRATPDLEDRVLEIARGAEILSGLVERPAVPTLFLSHDMDYLGRTLQMAIKNAISQKKFVFPSTRAGNYLDAVAEMFAFDASVVTEGLASTVFIAVPGSVRGIGRRAKQWLIDPSYHNSPSLLSELIRLTENYRSDVGLHGSYFSISQGLVPHELATLRSATGKASRIGRQHWLNLTHGPVAAMSYLRGSGIEVDSTLGWNGTVGFRCGMARPFSIALPGGGQIMEVPLVLMDRPLFADMGLSADEVLSLAKDRLEEVYVRCGGVAICWHDAAAHSDFGWFETYQRIVEWAANRGFKFSTISALCS